MSKLETFKKNLSENLAEAIRKISEGERRGSVTIDIRHFSQLDCDESLVREAINEVTTRVNAEINIYKLWFSFWWKCRIEVLAASPTNKVTQIDQY